MPGRNGCLYHGAVAPAPALTGRPRTPTSPRTRAPRVGQIPIVKPSDQVRSVSSTSNRTDSSVA